MLRHCLFAAGSMFLLVALSPEVKASDTCARAMGGTCKPGQAAPSKPQGTAARKVAKPAASKGRDGYSADERARFMEDARKLCQKRYGAPSRVYRIDYKRNTVICEGPTS